MARKKRNKQDSLNADGRKTKIRINCLSDNAIIIMNDGENIKVKSDNQCMDTSCRRIPKKREEHMDMIQSLSTKDIFKIVKQTENIDCSQKEGGMQQAIGNKTNPKVILSEIKKPKRKQKKDKNDTMAGIKADKPKKTNELRKELYKVFIGYRRMTEKIEKELNLLGFTVKRKRNHIILSLPYNGKTHTFAISVSASDNRCGYKIVSNIMQVINLRKSSSVVHNH